jgi:hypothetical protein
VLSKIRSINKEADMQDFTINVRGATNGRIQLGGIPPIGGKVRLHGKAWRVVDCETDLDAARNAVQNKGEAVPVYLDVEAID